MSMTMQLRDINRMTALLSNPELHNREGIERFSDEVINLPNAMGEDPFPLYHHFSDGIYTREIHIPAGHIVVGKIHKHESTVQLLKGSLLVADETGFKRLEAPCQFVSPGGVKRVAFILDDIVWIDIHATTENTVEEAEKHIFASSYSELEYSNMVKSIGYTEEEISHISRDERDVMHDKQAGIEIRESEIQGVGAFSTKSFEIDEVIGRALLKNRRTLIGRYTNHAAEPNSKKRESNDGIWFYAAKKILPGDEITINYADVARSKL